MDDHKLFSVLKVSISLMVCIVLLIIDCEAGWAEGLVSCRYLKASGKEIVLELDVKKPVPSMVIVMQKIPQGTTVINASPNFKKYNKASGEVKWLLTDIKPGRILIAMNLDKPASSGNVNGEIRYKDPITAATVLMAITP